MHEDVQRRLARNEDLFRRSNEAVARGLWPGEERGPLRLRCECASLDCAATIEIPEGAYDEVRAHPDRFIVCAGHEVPAVERVVKRRDGYVVVEKDGLAGDVAAELRDSRS